MQRELMALVSEAVEPSTDGCVYKTCPGTFRFQACWLLLSNCNFKAGVLPAKGEGMATRIDFAVLVRLVLKLSGLVLVIFGLIGLSTALLAGLAAMVDDLSFPGGGQTLFLLGASPVVLLVAGLVLWLFPTPIANTVVVNGPQECAPFPDWTESLQAVLLLALVLYFLIDGFSALIYDGVYQYVVSSATQVPITRDGLMIASIAGNAVQIALGLYLVLGRRGLLEALNRLRESGLHDAAK